MSSGIWNYIGERRGGRASSTLRALYVLLVVILLAGCGPQRVARQDTAQEDAGNGGGVITIESIGVVGEGNSILIEASDKVKYTAFRLADPPRLLIDMPGVAIEKVDRPILVDNDYITEITTSIYGEGERKIGRIEVGHSPIPRDHGNSLRGWRRPSQPSGLRAKSHIPPSCCASSSLHWRTSPRRMN